MKKNYRLKIISVILLSLSLLSLVASSSLAAGQDDNDADITLYSSLSFAGNGEREISGSGELHSTVLKNTVNFSVEDKQKNRKPHLIVTRGGETKELKDPYYMLVCDSEDDYGTVLIAVATSDGTVLGEYEVTVVYDGEDGFFVRKLKEFRNEFVNNFINDNRYLLLLRGLGNTLIITLCALLIGIVIGTLVAAVRSTYDKNAETYKLYKSVGGKIMKAVNALCKLYLTVIRGTPVVVQLMIMYFIIFAGGTSDLSVAIVAFGINSGAYVAEILRGGIMSVDAGQFEAGRSLGFNYVQTMIYIIIPQMFKSSLPALCNEFISLLKETSVAGYVPIMELTKAGDIIRGRTYSAFMPLIAVALIYLVIVVILTKLVGILERRLRKNER